MTVRPLFLLCSFFQCSVAVDLRAHTARLTVVWLKLCQKHAHTRYRLYMVAERRCLTFETSLSGAMEQQLGALLQAQQMMQQNMLELMNHFASENSDKSEKKKMEQLDCRALGEMQQFTGGESEWVDWKFRFLNAVGSGSLTIRKVMTFAGENTEKGQGATCDQVIQRLEALPGTNDDLEGTYGFVKEMSGKIYNHLVKNCSDEAFGIGEVRGVWRRRGGVGEAAPEVQPAHYVADDAGAHGVRVPEGGEGV